MDKKIKFIWGREEDIKLEILRKMESEKVRQWESGKVSLCFRAALIALITLITLITSITCSAQTDRSLARDGNKLYKEKKYTDAEVKYKKSLSKNNELNEAKFNLGDAYYKEEKYDDASQQYKE